MKPVTNASIRVTTQTTLLYTDSILGRLLPGDGATVLLAVRTVFGDLC